MSINCWEHMKCGREPGGEKAGSLGICPTSSFNGLQGKNGGMGGGRCCWRVPESNGNGPTLPHWSDMGRNCLECVFFKKVNSEEGSSFVP